ncbi:MAG: 3-phenylpropionate/cinnamic acid dioxygenase subunit beta [Pseudomonadales bacterium]|nr:3-phenylpropionate/cinnamic acid dioxygenase subunit beta [Pseudomonadales bacterium]
MSEKITSEQMLLQYEIEQFLYHEANLLDERRFDEWINLLTQDIHYWMPIRRTTTSRELDKEFTAPGAMAFFDEDLMMLQLRVKKMTGKMAWSEDPPSRTRHFVSNIRIVDNTGDEITVGLNFHLYRTRYGSEEDSWIGRRQDVIRRVDGGLKLAQRHIYLDQTLILSQNLSNLF